MTTEGEAPGFTASTATPIPAPPDNLDESNQATQASPATIFLPWLLAGPGTEETAALSTTTSPAAAAAGALRLAMTAAPPWVEPGEVVSFTVTLSNTGEAALPALIVTATLPAGLQYVPAGGSGFRYDNRSQTLTWSVGDLAAGQGVMGGFGARVQGLAVGATVTATVTATGPTLKEALTVAAAVDVVPPRGDTVWATPEQGGLLRSADDRVLVKVPPGAVRARTKLMYTARPAQNGLLAVWALDAATEDTPASRPGGFGQPVELQIRPMPDEVLRGLTPLRLLAWDERAGAWQVLASTADPTRGTLSALVFGSGVYALASSGPTYGVTILPSLKAFTSELWSAAAVVSYDLDVPTGPAGLGLNLRLAYNSQGINILSQVAGGSYRSQASWVGLGWELAGIGSISRPLGKAGPYTLSFGGGAFEIKDVGGVLTTEPQGFLKIEHSGGLTWNTQPWIVRTPDGMKYTFGNPNGAVRGGTAYEPFWTDWNKDCSVRATQWGLTRIEDPAGNRWDITWAHEMKSVSSANGCPGDAGQYTRASYPETLSLTPAGTTVATVRVRLVREPRNDKHICKHNDPYQINTFGDGRLKQIVVEAYTAGAWRLVRRYDLGYTYDSTTLGCGGDSGAGNHSLLTSITQYGANGTSALPAYTFTYEGSGNAARLKTANNGYGGQVQFTYSPQWVGNNAGCTSYQWQVVTGQTVTNGSAVHGLGLFSTTVYTPTGAYAYVTPVGCHNGAEIPRETYEFLGHTAVEEVIRDAAGQAVAQRSHHYSYQYNSSTGKPDARKGKEALVVTTQPGKGELARTATEWRIQTVNGVEWPYTSAITQTLGSATTVTRYEYAPAYQGGAQYGNVTHIREYASASATTPYRTTLRQYVPNTTAWIVNKPAYSHVYAGDLPADLNRMVAGTWYIYSDNQTNPSPHWNQPVGNKGQLRGVRRYVRTTNGVLEFADTRYKHDAYGNAIEEQTYRDYGTATAWASTVANTVTTIYDSVFRVYPIQQTITPGAAGGATLTTTYRYYGVNAEAGQGSGLVGQLQSITDPNNAVTRLTYDAFGRVTEIRKPAAGWTNPATEKYVYSDSPAPLAVKHSLRDDANGDNSSAATYLEDWTYYDGLGQVIQTQREAASGSQSIVASTQYHPLGGVRQQNVPYFYAAAGGAYRTPDWNQPKTQYAYDALGRVTRVTHPDGTGVSTYYRDRQVAVIDALHRQTIREMDAFGRLQRVKEFSGSYPNGPGWNDPAYATTNYAYDVLDNLTQVTDAAGNVTTMTYDALGRKTGMTDPNMGTWSYAYDAAGNLVRQTDAKFNTIVFEYDGLNRLTHKWVDLGLWSYTLARYYYDEAGYGASRGRRTRAVAYNPDINNNGITSVSSWVYDQRGRVTRETLTVDNVSYVTDFTYDSADRVTTMTYPADASSMREVVTHTYNPATQLTQVRSTTHSLNYMTGLTYNALGQVTELTYGNNVQERRGYFGLGGDWDSRPGAGLYRYGRLWRIRARTAAGAPLFDLRYDYDSVGNITRQHEAPRAAGNWPSSGFTFQDSFNTKDTANWTWSSHQTVPFNDGGNNVVKSSGTDANWNANFYRSAYSLTGGRGLQLRFKVDRTDTQAHFAIEANDATYRRFGVIANGGKLYVQYNDGGGLRYPADLLTNLQVNTWYVVRIVVDDVRGFYVEAYQESAPSVRGSYQQWLPAGLAWRFRHWIWRGNAYLDDYREFGTAGLTWNPDERMNFTYDALHRLISAAPDSGAQGYTESYQYNAIGNLTYKSDVGTYTYPASGPNSVRPHAATAAGNNSYTYDANGNMLTRTENGVTYSQTWDAENRLQAVTVNGQTTTYVYDGDGQRVKKVQGGQTTIYVGNYYERNLSTGVVTTYYYANGQRVAMRRGSTVYYFTGDHLGSTSLVTDVSGGEVARQRYFPYGAPRDPNPSTLPTDYRFTGQRSEEAGLGSLYDYNARFYSPLLGRFLSPDTIVPEPGNPQALNRYSYVLNNALRFIDPSGYDPLDQAWQDEFRRVHGRDPTAEDMLIRLFSIAFPDEWDWGAFYTSDGALRPGAMTRVFSAIPVGRDWAGMPSATERLAGWYTNTETEAFVRDIGSLFAGLLTRFEEANGWRAITTGWVRDFVWVGRDGLSDELLGTDPTNNVHHWAWSLNLGYFRGEAIGRAINEGRELRDSGWNLHRYFTDPNHRADVALGNIGVAMGAYMSNGILPSRAPWSLQDAWRRMPLTVRAQ